MANSGKPRVLILFSDTGGGHRSAAAAIEEAIGREYAGRVSVECVDFLKRYAPFPFDRLPDVYPALVGWRRLWRAAFHAFDGRRRVASLTGPWWFYVRRAVRRLLEAHPADVIVSVHALANASILRGVRSAARRAGGAPARFAIVVVDLGTVHAIWFHRNADRIFVPNAAAEQRGVACGIEPDRMEDVGLPVVQRFRHPDTSAKDIRRRLGWPQDRPMALLVSGGEGMGNIEEVAAAIDTADLQCGLVIVAGRNQQLRSSLEARDWSRPTFVYGFVDEMSAFMNAADVLVSKAGPNTVCEALNAALPMVLYDHLPGQEEGNVEFVAAGGAGIWAPTPEAIVTALRTWLEDPEALARARDACRDIARPDAARDIARSLVSRFIPQAEQ